MLNIPSKYCCELGEVEIQKFLGKGKSGYSYLGILNNQKVVLKIMHKEENPYYDFVGNKVVAEIKAYEKLININNKIPKLIYSNIDKEFLIKEFIDGEVASSEIAKNRIGKDQIWFLIELSQKFEAAQFNIDYFPSNFVIKNDGIIYIDYEINPFDDKWSFRNWGIYYWLNSKGFAEFLNTNDASYINENTEKGIPFKKEFQDRASNFLLQFEKEK